MSTLLIAGTATGGASLSADTAGSLQIQTGSTPTTAVTVDASQKVTLLNDASISGLTVGKGNGSVSNNTAVGSNVLSGSNTGSGLNTAVGASVLASNTSGQENSAFGVSSLGNNTTGSSNTGIGRSALANNTTASNNTAVGYQAGQAITTATANACFGAYSGFSLTTGSTTTGYNTFIGRYAGYSSTTDLNTFVGNAAGYLCTTGTKNTILGGYTGNQGGLDIRTASNYIVLSDGDGNPRGIFDGSGNFLVGTTSAFNSGKICVDGGSSYVPITCRVTPTTGFTQIYFSNGNGIVGSIYTSGSATTYATSSDYRLKENIAPMSGALDTVSKLKPVTYKWKVDGSDGQGFIAHELQAVVPDAVVGVKDAVDLEGNPQYQQIDTSFLVATLTAAIQELNAKVTALEAQLGAK